MTAQWREVLIVTGGSTPQVVTETIYALGKRAPEPIIPSKIICVVTKGVADRFGCTFETALGKLKSELKARGDWERRLQDWHSETTGLFVEFPHTQDGTPVNDIRTNDDVVLFGDLVSEIVRYETSDQGARVHLSLGGGRKTMSFDGGAALSLFGRAQDELLHVLPDGIGPVHRGWLTAAMFEYPERYRPNPVERFIEIYEETFKVGHGRPENLGLYTSSLTLTGSEAFKTKLQKTQVARFAAYKSHLLDALQERLRHPDLAIRFGSPLKEVRIPEKGMSKGSPKTVHRMVFGLPLLPSEIIINFG
jgi:CRISPR-associated protein (TIGR02584 family)